MASRQVAWVAVRGAWVRHARLDALTDEPSAGRWQTTEHRAMYLADSEATAWAEMYRAIAERQLPPQDAFPREIITIDIDLERVADLTRAAARRALGLPRLRPTRAQWQAFQAVGAQLRADSAQGILYASAARARARCLCVFEAGLPHIQEIGERTLHRDPPAPPRGLRT